MVPRRVRGMIGQYLVRVSKSGAAVTLAHLVESEIAERVVTHCGRQMARKNRDGTLRPCGPVDGLCSQCDGPVLAVGEGDVEYMCPNCVTPWKCNGPHIPEPLSQSRRDDLLDDSKVWPI